MMSCGLNWRNQGRRDCVVYGYIEQATYYYNNRLTIYIWSGRLPRRIVRDTFYHYTVCANRKFGSNVLAVRICYNSPAG